jgi:hypothetical protein
MLHEDVFFYKLVLWTCQITQLHGFSLLLSPPASPLPLLPPIFRGGLVGLQWRQLAVGGAPAPPAPPLPPPLVECKPHTMPCTHSTEIDLFTHGCTADLFADVCLYYLK